MNNKEIPTRVKTNTKEIGFSEINRDFSSTEYGHQLASNVRYDRYKPSNMSNPEWEHLLGVDVNNLKHLRLTYGLARQFIKYSIDLPISSEESNNNEEQLTPKEQEDILLASIVHDWAEAVVGDHSYDLKTLKEEDVEFEELKNLTDSIYKKNNKELLNRINYVTDTIIKDPNSKLGKIFNAVERIGYLRTSLRSWEKSKDASGDLKTNLEWLTNNVFLNQISKLIQYSEIYPAVGLYLKENKELINDAFNNLSDNIFSKYSSNEIVEKTKQFKMAQKGWQEYYQKII